MESINAILFESFTRPTPDMLAELARTDVENQRAADALDKKLLTLKLQEIWASGRVIQ